MMAAIDPKDPAGDWFDDHIAAAIRARISEGMV
jgi:hypothetical protein